METLPFGTKVYLGNRSSEFEMDFHSQHASKKMDADSPQEFDFEIKYRPGKANVVVDALTL